MSAAVHLVPTPEDFRADVERKFGPDAVLHPANRITACGRHGGSLRTTEILNRVTCKTCLRHPDLSR